MVRSIVVAICAVFLLVACEQEPTEPINPARVATNRAILQKCLEVTPCVGGFVIERSEGRIRRLKHGDRLEFETIGITFLLGTSDEMINRYEFVLPSDQPKWNEVAVAFSLQFTPIPHPPID